MNKMRYLLKKGESGRPRNLVLQELVHRTEVSEEGHHEYEEWVDVPTIFEEDL